MSEKKMEDKRTWVQTAGVASPWLLDPGSAMPQALLFDLGASSVQTDAFYPVELPEDIIFEAPLQVDLSVDEKDLQKAMISLLSFSPETDEPGEEDIGAPSVIRFPDSTP